MAAACCNYRKLAMAGRLVRKLLAPEHQHRFPLVLRTSHQSVVYASLVIPAIPTFLVFAFWQNLIMRGIVVPVEK